MMKFNSLPDPLPFMMDDQPHEACGVIAIFAPGEDVARMAFFGLFALQHRGQEAAGIAVSNGFSIRMHKDIGLVYQVFNPSNLAPLTGSYAIGHNRIPPRSSSVAMPTVFLLKLVTVHCSSAQRESGEFPRAA